MIIAGHGRLLAAKQLGLDSVPVMRIEGLSAIQKRKLLIADNKISLNAGWDRNILAQELNDIILLEGDISLTGFETVEVDAILLDQDDAADPADMAIKPTSGRLVTQRGDIWQAGTHRVGCGDARDHGDVGRLCGNVRAGAIYMDPPYNRRISQIVGRGKKKHEEFKMASGEMSHDEFREFLRLSLQAATAFSLDGSLHFVCMDWRGIESLMAIGREVYGRTINIAVWVKANGGQGSFYRSQHEFVAVFQVGEGPLINNIELGKHGRNRTNVWQYAGVNSFRKGRLDELRLHPTVKPVAMIADAIKDCTRRGDYVLDTFGGSGSTLMACEKVGRNGLLLEIEPAYVDVTIKRWQQYTGKDAIHAASGKTFDKLLADCAEFPVKSEDENNV
jgi:DNA modification methylase